jgi:hypothetical protein
VFFTITFGAVQIGYQIMMLGDDDDDDDDPGGRRDTAFQRDAIPVRVRYGDRRP